MYFLIRPKAGSELLINYIGIYLTEFACGIIGTGIFLVKLKNNVKRAWWKKFIQENPYNVGVDCAILMNP